MLLIIGFCTPAHAQAALPLGADAPAFTLPDTEGRARALAEWARRPVVLNFWAFWCDTWKAELPSLRELAADQSSLGFALVAVSVDGTRVPEFTRQRGTPTPFPVLLDTESVVSHAYGVAHVPTVVILDGQGRVRYTHIGYRATMPCGLSCAAWLCPQAARASRRPRPLTARHRAGARAQRPGTVAKGLAFFPGRDREGLAFETPCERVPSHPFSRCKPEPTTEGFVPSLQRARNAD